MVDSRVRRMATDIDRAERSRRGFSVYCLLVVVVRRRLDAFDTWCLRKILRIPITNQTSGILQMSQFGASQAVCQSLKGKCSLLKFFGHLARSPVGVGGRPSPCRLHRTATAISDWRRPVHGAFNSQ